MTSLHYLDPNPDGRTAVLLLHGLGANAASWALQLHPLCTAGFRPIAPDAPGFGGSPYDGRGWTIPRMAAEMADLLQELSCHPANVVGLSMGGIIAQQFALDYPSLTCKLVLVSSFAVLRPDSPKGWLYFLRRLMLVSLLGLPAQARAVARHVFPNPGDGPIREMLVDTISKADPRAYRRAMFALGTFSSVRRLEQLLVPTLVVTGDRDTTVSPARQHLLARGIQDARHEIIAMAGHAVPVDQPEAFNRILLGFLTGE